MTMGPFEMSAGSHTLPGEPPLDLVFGKTAAMQNLKSMAMRIATTDLPTVISGESGTGKEVLAKVIHANSLRCGGPWLKVHCPAIPGELLESELFGYVEGAFTGAHKSKPGLVQLAAGGTLFLDEIADLPLGLQPKLLRLLQDGTYWPVGSDTEERADIRVVSASNQSLEHAVGLGQFRRDLYYRINVVALSLSPLRERCLDIPQLASFFLTRYLAECGREVAPISDRLMELFLHYDWPGNIRELQNIVRRYVVLGSEDLIGRELLGRNPAAADDKTERPSLKSLTQSTIRELERRFILEALYDHNWNRKAAARSLQISYRALFYKLKQSGLPAKRKLRPSDVPKDPERTECYDR